MAMVEHEDKRQCLNPHGRYGELVKHNGVVYKANHVRYEFRRPQAKLTTWTL